MDPVREAAFKRKEKERSLSRKKVKDMAPRELRRMKKCWKKWDKNRRDREKHVQLLVTPPDSPIPPVLQLNGNALRGRRTVLKNRSKVVREKQKLEKENLKLQEERDRWRRKYWAAAKKNERETKKQIVNNTPKVALMSPITKAKHRLQSSAKLSPQQMKLLEKKVTW